MNMIFPFTPEEVEKGWVKFAKWFWIFFAIKVAGYIGAYSVGRNEGVTDTALVWVGIQLLAVICTMILMGYFSYYFSRKWWYVLDGLWGGLWVGIVLIFIGFFIIRDRKDRALKMIEKGDLKELPKTSDRKPVPKFQLPRLKVMPLKPYLLVMALVVAVGGAAFYWWELRPAAIHSECSSAARLRLKKASPDTILDAQRFYDLAYKQCLRDRGL